MPKKNDAELVVLICKEDKGAEKELLMKYWPRVLKTVRYTLSRGRTNCEDLASEISMATLVNLRNGKFAGESSLGTYIYGINKNKIAAYLRGRRPEIGEIPEGYPDGAPTREEEMEKEETTQALKLTLKQLHPKYKNVLFLFYYKGLSIIETG